MSVLVGLDIGTSGARALAISEGGKVIAESSANYPLHQPQPGWTEQNPEDWWKATKQVLGDIAEKVDDSIVGLGLTGQMHGSVFLDSSDKVIRPAILWNDQRTAAQCEKITDKVGAERLISITGNPAITGFQAPKIVWLQEEEPENFDRTARVLLPKDYVRLRLTGEAATDASDASGTLLLDVKHRQWSKEILEALEIPVGWMPRVYEGPEKTGRVRGHVARKLGLPEGISVAAGGGDNAAAAIGTGIIEEGLMSSSIGTSGVLFAHTDDFAPDPSGRIHAFCHAVPGKYHLMGVTLSAGGSLQWWHDALNEGFDYDELAAMASEAPPGAEGLVFLPYLSGERAPHLDPMARGAFFGLTSRHGRSHMTRALMEGVVFSLRDSLGIIRNLGVTIDQVRATGGGARSALWRQLQADVYNATVYRTVAEEGPAYGAALLSGVASGVYENIEEACLMVKLHEKSTTPNPQLVPTYDEFYGAYSSLYPATRKVMERLAEISLDQHDKG